MKKKRKKRKTIPKIDVIDDFYQYITKVQTKKEIITFTIVDLDLTHVVENVMNDCSLKFDKIEFSKGTRYKVYPNFDEVIVDVNIDELKDEFLEEGQLF